MTTEGLKHNHIEITKQEEEILAHTEAPKTILELQMSLAEELYEIDYPNVKLDFNILDVRNKILNHWIDSKYSRYFRQLVEKKGKMNENPMEITLGELRGFRGEVGRE
jgi:hypothetical protein